MKILTINTHSLLEDSYEEKLEQFVEVIAREKPDVFAMQEVNQSIDAEIPSPFQLSNMVPCGTSCVPVRRDNHAARIAEMLFKKNVSYYWTWLPVKLGYSKYDEGLALFSLRPIVETDSFYISTNRDYQNWKTRCVLGIRTDEPDAGWFYTVHMGWWLDREEPFQIQWGRLDGHLDEKCESGTVWLLGDCNSPAHVEGEGYDCIRHSGWYDTYTLAKRRDSGVTVKEAIDGWRDQREGTMSDKGMRIDFIWCNEEREIKSSRTIFTGTSTPRVSDHYGVVIELDKEEGSVL